MRLPGQLEFGVQTLGRPDKGAMRDKAAAEGQAALAWGDALATAGTELANVATASGLADANLTLSERVSMDKKSTAELDAWLSNNQSFNMLTITAPATESTVPDAVRMAAERLGLTDQVDTYEIAIEASRLHFEQSRKDSVAAMGEKNQSRQAITNYNKQMDNIWARSAASATQTHHVQRIQHLSARADLSYNEALNNLDEAEMEKIAVDAEQSGIWTPEYAGAKMASIGATIDTVAATRQYRDAVTQEDIDQADLFVDKSRIAPSERMGMMKLSDQMQEQQHKMEMRKQPINYGNAVAQLIDGKLTKDMVADMARTQQISGTHANTLRNALIQTVPLTSTPAVMDRFLGEAAGLRFQVDGEPLRITERAEQLRRAANAAFTGAGVDGEPIDRSLTGKDLSTIMQLIDKNENEGLGKGGQKYAVAARSIKALTGYNDLIGGMIKGNYPVGQAKAAFDSALQEYMDLDGSDPSAFVAQNAHRFTGTLYKKAAHERLAFQFPAYSKELIALSEDPPNPEYSAGQVLLKALKDMEAGRLPVEHYETLTRGLDYMILEGRMGVAVQNTDATELFPQEAQANE